MKLPKDRVYGQPDGLSERELYLLWYVASSINATGVQPTYRDIQKFMGYKSTNSVMSFIQGLLLKGVIWETTGHGFMFDWKAYVRTTPCGTVRGKRSVPSAESPPANTVVGSS